MRSQLQSVLDEAHRAHTYVTDATQYGTREHWSISLTGDCEDFALWVRERLKDEGIAANLVLCKTENDVGHLVVSVDGWILDNRHEWVMPQQKLPYTWLKLGEPDGTWYEIEEPPL